MNNILSPSILAADFCRLGEQIKEVERAGARYLHIDVMDGMFVPDISFGMPVIESIRNCSDIFFDVHPMIEKPKRYIKAFVDCGSDMINFHVEATNDVAGTIGKIKFYGKKAGITIKPETPVEAVEPYLKQVDMVLVMTLEPGFGGQPLMPECLEKVRRLRAMIDERGLRTDIEVDGGMRMENVDLALEAGANIIVSGSAVFRNKISDNVARFMEKLNGSR